VTVAPTRPWSPARCDASASKEARTRSSFAVTPAPLPTVWIAFVPSTLARNATSPVALRVRFHVTIAPMVSLSAAESGTLEV
jgi:hypothetical protein